MGETERAKIKDLKEGKCAVIDGEPCRIVSIQKSKPGKHGAAKARVEGVSLFTGNKKTLLGGVDTDCEVPVMKKETAQVIANLGGNRLQLMDLASFETYEISVENEYKDLQSGAELEVQNVMDKRMIMRAK
ncbi:MAG: translation initiation factor IF-5A [Candidatus Micrarchaeota archaeon]